MTIAITGATGQLGRLVINTLKTKNAPGGIVALARNIDKAADLGVPARIFDYDAPKTLPAALDGVDTLLLISGSDIGRRVSQHAAVIEAAKAAGVQHIVYTSVLKAPSSTLGLAPEHVETENLLAASGIGPYRAAQRLVYRELRHGPACGAGTQRPDRRGQGWPDLVGYAAGLCRGRGRRAAGHRPSGQNL